MGYVILGAGAVGGAIGGLLHLSGGPVTLVARGQHLEAMRSQGLRLTVRGRSHYLRVPVVGSLRDLTLSEGDIAIMATKSQDTAALLTELAAVAPQHLPIVCAQNGVENERVALRLFERVYGMCVVLPATHVKPGEVQLDGLEEPGLLHIGRYPSGVDDIVPIIVRDLRTAGFLVRQTADIMPIKFDKLLRNLSNSLEALCGKDALDGELARRAWKEAMTVLKAAGIDVSKAEMRSRDRFVRISNSGMRPGRSLVQSVLRGQRSIEVDYLNGEIVLLGRLHGVPTPVNTLLQRESKKLVVEGTALGAVTSASLMRKLDEVSHP